MRQWGGLFIQLVSEIKTAIEQRQDVGAIGKHNGGPFWAATQAADDPAATRVEMGRLLRKALKDMGI